MTPLGTFGELYSLAMNQTPADLLGHTGSTSQDKGTGQSTTARIGRQHKEPPV